MEPKTSTVRREIMKYKVYMRSRIENMELPTGINGV